MLEQLVGMGYAPGTIGRVAVATGISGFGALAFTVLAFAFGRRVGQVGDAFAGLTGLLGAGLGMLLFPEQREIAPQIAVVALGLVVLGGSVAAFGAVLATTEATSWFLAQLYVAAGYAMIGAWLLTLSATAGTTPNLPHRAVTLGFYAGTVMALGFGALPGILAGAANEHSAPWLSRYVGRAGYLGWLLLFPIWCIWVGQSRLGY